MRMSVFESAITTIEYDKLRWGVPPERINRLEMQRLRALLPGHSVDHVSEQWEETVTLSGPGATYIVSKCRGHWLLSVAREWPGRTEIHRAEDVGEVCRMITKSMRKK